MRKFLVLMLVGFCCWPGSSFGITRNTIHQQGLLVDLEGAPLEGFHEMTFRFYRALEGGDPLWEETAGITFIGGFYSADLGATELLPDDLFLDEEDLYLGVVLDDQEEFFPRFPVTSVPFSRVAEVAVTALSVDDSIVLPR